MKKFLRYILVAAISSCIIPFSSCSDDDENAVNEWNMTYVSLLPTNYLKPIQTVTLDHFTGKEIEGTVAMDVMATIQKAASNDITVDISATCEGISSEKIIMSSNKAVIKAGSTKSEPVSISITDWSDIASVSEAAEYTLNINVAGIESVASDVVLSDLHKSLSVKIQKKEEREEDLLFFGKAPENSTLNTDITNWVFTFMDGVENAAANSVNGKGGGDVATNGTPFWLTVDLKEVKNVTGIQTSHWGGGYCPTKVEIFTSENGSSWKSMGQVATSGAYHDIAFKYTVATRYLKYQMIEVPSRVDITKFYIYTAN